MSYQKGSLLIITIFLLVFLSFVISVLLKANNNFADISSGFIIKHSDLTNAEFGIFSSLKYLKENKCELEKDYIYNTDLFKSVIYKDRIESFGKVSNIFITAYYFCKSNYTNLLNSKNVGSWNKNVNKLNNSFEFDSNGITKSSNFDLDLLNKNNLNKELFFSFEYSIDNPALLEFRINDSDGFKKIDLLLNSGQTNKIKIPLKNIDIKNIKFIQFKLNGLTSNDKLIMSNVCIDNNMCKEDEILNVAVQKWKEN